jgi:hypothetical protein
VHTSPSKESEWKSLGGKYLRDFICRRTKHRRGKFEKELSQEVLKKGKEESMVRIRQKRATKSHQPLDLGKLRRV